MSGKVMRSIGEMHRRLSELGEIEAIPLADEEAKVWSELFDSARGAIKEREKEAES